MKETAIKLHIYVPKELDDEEARLWIDEMLGEEIPYQIYDVEVQKVED
jgi:hypothetical protein